MYINIYDCKEKKRECVCVRKFFSDEGCARQSVRLFVGNRRDGVEKREH